MSTAVSMIRLVSLVVVFSILAVIAFFVIDKANISRAELPFLGEVGNFEFVESDGQPFGKEQLIGKISVVDFFFTRCKGPCPIMSLQMGRLYDLFKDSDQIQFVSITVDPEVDSLDVMKQYAADLNVTDKRWLFVRGEMDELRILSEKSFMLAADELPGGHSTKFVLVDKFGMIRNYYSGTEKTSVDQLIVDIRQLVKGQQ